MEVRTTSDSLREGPFSEYVGKGRCKSCWGALRGRTDTEWTVTGIRCLVCGELLEGEEAAAEAERINSEATINALNMWWGQQPTYGDGPFAQKVFPNLERLSETEIESRISLSKAGQGKSPQGKLTRHDFPAGSPGWLFLQARFLIDWMGEATDHRRDSIAEFPDIDMNADGSASLHIDMDGISEDPEHREHELLKRVGAFLGNGMISAFACEIAMKCVSMTCKDECAKTHDLLDLFEDLPRDSQDRLRADYPSIEDALTESRGVFGAWRYFEAAVGTDAFRSMMHPDRSRSLAKAARVILDEAEYVGLSAALKIQANRKVRVSDDKRTHEDKISLTIRGGEAPLRP